MKNKINNISITVIVLMSFIITLPVLAQTSGSATKLDKTAKSDSSVEKKTAKTFTAAQEKGIKEIDRRVESLTNLSTRVTEMKNVSAEQKALVNKAVQSLIVELGDLKTVIETTASSTELKKSLEAIPQNYRIYALVMPQIHIIVANDRIISIADMLTALSAKLTKRVTAIVGLPKLVEIQTALANINTKAANAKLQAETALATVSALVPDGGDKTRKDFNTAALKEARTKVKSAEKDLQAARKDAKMVIKALVDFDKNQTKNASSTDETVKEKKLPENAR